VSRNEKFKSRKIWPHNGLPGTSHELMLLQILYVSHVHRRNNSH